LEESALEEIPERFIPPPKATVQSDSSWRQAQSYILTEVDTQVSRS